MYEIPSDNTIAAVTVTSDCIEKHETPRVTRDPLHPRHPVHKVGKPEKIG